MPKNIDITFMGESLTAEYQIIGWPKPATMHCPEEFYELEILSIKDLADNVIDTGLESDLDFFLNLISFYSVNLGYFHALCLLYVHHPIVFTILHIYIYVSWLIEKSN